MRLAMLRREGDFALAFAGEDGSVAPLRDMPGLSDLALALREALETPADNRWLLPEAQAALAGLAASATARLGPLPAGWRLAPPVPRPGKIIAVGRNYMDHVREGQEIWAKRGKVVSVPEFPSAFAKYPSSLSAHGDPIRIPAGHDDVDYEVELAVVIGRPALDVGEAEALAHVAGYTVCNDIGARGIQRREMEAQIGIVLAKNFPGFAPMGPWLVSADEVPDPQALEVKLTVDGDVRQRASTADMIFPVALLISYWSRMGLETGDVIITGTPSGVALARPEPEKFYLRSGQTVTASVSGVGSLVNPVVATAG